MVLRLYHGRSGCVDQSFQFQTGDDVLSIGVGVFLLLGWVVWVVTGCYDYGTNFNFDPFCFLVVIDCSTFTDLVTEVTFDTVIFVYGSTQCTACGNGM